MTIKLLLQRGPCDLLRTTNIYGESDELSKQENSM